MKTALSLFILVLIVALAGFSFVPGATLSGPALWAGLGLLCLAGGVVWWLDRRADRGRRKDD